MQLLGYMDLDMFYGKNQNTPCGAIKMFVMEALFTPAPPGLSTVGLKRKENAAMFL